MYQNPNYSNGTIKRHDNSIAETLEKKIQKLMQNKENIEGTTDLIYQERHEGVQAAYNIKTDRFEVALQGKEAIAKSEAAKRQLKIGERTYDSMTPEQQQKFNKEFPMNKFAKAQQVPNPNTGGTK